MYPIASFYANFDVWEKFEYCLNLKMLHLFLYLFNICWFAAFQMSTEFFAKKKNLLNFVEPF